MNYFTINIGYRFYRYLSFKSFLDKICSITSGDKGYCSVFRWRIVYASLNRVHNLASQWDMLLNSEYFEHSKIKYLPYVQLHERRLLLQTPVPTILPSRNISSLIERWLCHTPLPSYSLQKYGNYASVSWKSIRNIFNKRNCTSTVRTVSRKK